MHVPDWLAAGLVGFGPMLVRLGSVIRVAQAAAGGQPLLVVAHSGGGIVARLAMSEAPFRGRRSAVGASVGALVTLGTPHGLASGGVRSAHNGVAAARFLDRRWSAGHLPPSTAYLTVGSDFVRPDGLLGERAGGGRARRRLGPLTWWDRLLARGFEAIVGPLPAEGGDGIVSVTAAHLAGAEQLTFHDVRHGVIGGPWYGDEEIVDRWWPRAVELWRGALAYREAPR